MLENENADLDRSDFFTVKLPAQVPMLDNRISAASFYNIQICAIFFTPNNYQIWKTW